VTAKFPNIRRPLCDIWASCLFHESLSTASYLGTYCYKCCRRWFTKIPR